MQVLKIISKNIYKSISGDDKFLLILIFLFALFIRIIAVSALPAEYMILKVDAQQYDDMAVSLLSGKGYVTDGTGFVTRSWKPPAYPLFLALVYLIFGHNYLTVMIIQCIMGALQCIIIFYIAKIIFNRQVALLSAIILTFYPPYIFNRLWGPGILFSDYFFSFLFALAILFMTGNLFDHFSVKNSIITGALLGILALTRPIIALFPLFLFGLFLYKNKYSIFVTAKKILPLFFSFILVILPWTVRNYYVHKAFVPFSTEGGFVLFSGNNPLVRGGGLTDFKGLLTEEEMSSLNKMSEVQRDSFYRSRAKEFLFKNYKKIPKLFFKKLLAMWDVYATDYDLDGRRRYNIWYAIILMFGLVGFFRSLKSKLNINTLLLILLFIYFSIIALVFCGDPRFRYPIEPYLIVFASVGGFTIYNTFRNKLLSYMALGIIVGINFLIYSHSDLVLSWIRRLL